MVKPLFYGRLGNVLFQAASAIAYALEHGLEYTVPTETDDPKWNPVYLGHLANPNWNPELSTVVVEEKDHFPYHQRPFLEEWRNCNIILDGYWQTEKYFMHCRRLVESAFGFRWQPQCGVAVHVRRGDYLRLKKKHPPVPKEKIERMMVEFPTQAFFFFSDDIQWCKDTFGHRSDCFFRSGQSELQDLIEMSWYEHQICSASTFSWWAAWLNRNPAKRILMPQPWFVGKWKGLDTRDIVPVEWERF